MPGSEPPIALTQAEVTELRFCRKVAVMTKHSFEYDLVTIGAGGAGVRASRFAAKHHNAKVAVVELPYAPVASSEKGGAGGTCGSCCFRACVRTPCRQLQAVGWALQALWQRAWP